jgi:hypothetical protein
MQKIYVVGCLRVDLKMITAKRAWIIYDNFKDAEEHMLNNYCDCFEGSFNYGLIEEITVNSGHNIPKTFWYKATHKNYITKVKKIKCTKMFEKTCNFFVG